MNQPQDHISSGYDALKAGRWESARAHFESALSLEASPEAHDGLGIALWWLNSIEESHAHRASAYTGFKSRGDLRRASAIAIWLAREQVFLHSNVSAMNGWFARADRLLASIGSVPERGWYLLFRASMLDAPQGLLATTHHAETIAREHNDIALEVLALAFAGLAKITLGQVNEGMLAIDEAMAAATSGEVDNFMVISEVFCVTLSACEMVGDLVRTEHWCNAAFKFAERYNCPFLSAYCRTTYGGLLAAGGRWHDAERELLTAIRAFDSGHKGLRVHALLKLADLRVCQGRLEEAEALLSMYEDYGAAVIPLARLHLARDEPQLARAVLDRALPPGASHNLDKAPILLLLVDTLLQLGDLGGANRAARDLSELAKGTGSDLLLAQSELVEGQLKRSLGDISAEECLRAALQHLRTCEQSLLAARARLEMARLLSGTDRPGAVAWARAALASFERLGATRQTDEASKLLRQLGAGSRGGTRLDAPLSQRELEVVALIVHGLTNKEIAARLFISNKTVEHHVSQILNKLGARTRAEAVAWAIGEGISRPDQGPTVGIQ